MKTLPSHLFVTSEGDLFDTRNPHWASSPVREKYCYTFREIKTPGQLAATLRAGASTFPGCYPLYFVTLDGEAVSFKAVEANPRRYFSELREYTSGRWGTGHGDRIFGTDINFEDDDLYCADTGEKIPSAYGPGDDEE